MDKLPYLTVNLPGVGGKIKTRPEDFYVEEIPQYEACGEGQHVYLRFEKVGLTTLSALNRIAQSLGVRVKQIGYAGLKDAQAVTQQTISIDNVSPERIKALSLAGIKVISVARHRNKIKIGHLAGNRFVIRIREVEQSALPQASTILMQLQSQGVPNYYGEQRFGLRQNSHFLGLALMRDKPAEFLAQLLGRPHPDEMERAQKARAAFDAGSLEEALNLWPPSLRAEWVILKKLVKTRDAQAAVRVLDRRLKRLFVSAYQSYLFNLLLAQRLATLNKIEAGDVAYIHHKRVAFVVESAKREQPRVDAFEISPAGPLFGPKYLPAAGNPGRREVDLLNQVGILLPDFNVPRVRLEGGRRPYRVPLNHIDVKWDDGIVVSFTLPPGSYATMVLREIMKNG